MATVTAKDVAALRAKTGLGMMDCKKALVEADGDMDKAVKILREKGLSTAEKKQSRIAAEGLVDILVDGETAVMIEVNTETDFVAKNAKFREFVTGLLKTIAADKPADLEALMKLRYEGTDNTVEATLVEMIAMIGEKLSIRRFVVVDGTLSTYIHGNGMTGVIVKFEADEVAKNNAGFAEFAKNIALQIAAGSPPTYITREDVPEAVLDEEKAIVVKQLKNDASMAKKPESVLEKIAAGKLGKFFEANCLVEQDYVKDDKITVGQYVAQTAKEFGGAIKISSFFIFEKGEGIAKKEEDFAEEIAKLAGRK